MDDFEAHLKKHLAAEKPDSAIDFSELDRAVIAALSATGRKTIAFPSWLRAAAAVLVVGFSITLILKTAQQPHQFAREDINLDGQIDIVDAFALAQRLQSGETEHLKDLNGDGEINQGDVRHIANIAVAVGS